MSARAEAVEQLRASVAEHETLREQVQKASADLFERRQRVAAEVIGPVEEYVNGLANTPKEFDKSVRAFRVEIERSSAPSSASRRRSPRPGRSEGASAWQGRRPEWA
ncbi:MAG: hypothetical protein OXH70_20275 [Acidobacteria bacterium]|nr:hypothetical protein [Acidobacteriota bacterium]